MNNGDKTRGGSNTETGKESSDEDLSVGVLSRSFDSGSDEVDHDECDTSLLGTKLLVSFR